MKILIILSLLQMTCFATENWIAESHTKKSNNQEPGVKGYMSKEACETETKETCYEFSNRNLRYEYVENGQWKINQTKKEEFDSEQNISQIKKQKKEERKQELINCMGILKQDNPPQSQFKDCVKTMLREIASEILPVSDL